MHYSSSTPELAGLQHVTEYLEFASGTNTENVCFHSLL